MAAVRPLRIYRVTAVTVAVIYGWWLLTSFRTTSVGNGDLLMLVLLGLLYVLPIATLALLGLEARRVATYALLMVAVALAGALGWANIEEFILIHGTASDEQRTIQRWWPFEHRMLIYTPDEGWVAQQ